MLKLFPPLLFIAAIFLSGARADDVDPSALVGQTAPTCDVPTLAKQQPLDLTHYHGKVVYMDFWASWCPPCRVSFPLLNALHNELQQQGFEVVAINVDENHDDLMGFLQAHPVDFTIGVDPEGTCPIAYNVMAMPSSYLIDKKGVIRHVHHGFRKDDITAIRQLALALIAEPSS